MTRTEYFERIRLNPSPLLRFTGIIEFLLLAAADNSKDSLLLFADYLSDLNTTSSKARASFIRLSIGGISTEDLFEEYRESWGIPIF